MNEFKNTQNQNIADYDADLSKFLEAESVRQEEHIELIASENYASKRVLEAQGSVLTNKYAEDYPIKGITADANTLMELKRLLLKEQKLYSMQDLLMFNLIQALLLMPQFF